METLPGATIVIVMENIGAITNTSGNFILVNIDVGRHALHVSYVGYEPKLISE